MLRGDAAFALPGLYSNASLSLPDAVGNPDADFLGVTLAIVLALCVLAFAAGAWLARQLRAGPAQRVALMYGLGMNNNGTGLVLASLALADHPRVDNIWLLGQSGCGSGVHPCMRGRGTGRR